MSASPLQYELRSAELLTDVLSDSVIVRVTYRERLTKPWRHFNIVPDEGESVQSIAAKLWPAIAADAHRRLPRG